MSKWPDHDSIGPLTDAYAALLRLPHKGPRARLQSTLAAVRDELADLTQWPVEELQKHFEAQATFEARKQ